MELEIALAVALELFLVPIVKTLVKIEVFDHVEKNLTKFLYLFHDLPGDLVGKVLLFFGVFVNWVILFGQQLQIFFVNVYSCLVFSLTHLLELTDAVYRKLLIVIFEEGLENREIRKQLRQTWVSEHEHQNVCRNVRQDSLHKLGSCLSHVEHHISPDVCILDKL
jgi:hypothetical protein